VGPAGPAGARGPSDAYHSSASETGVTASELSSHLATSLPAGSYTGNAKVVVTNPDPTQTHTVTCELTMSSADLDTSTVVVGPAGSPSSSQSVALQGVGTAASAAVMEVDCLDLSGLLPAATYGWGQLTAVEVGTLH